MFKDITLKPIGIVKSPYKEPGKMPIPGRGGVIEVFPEYIDALLHIEENSHLWILTWFHLSRRDVLTTVPHRIDSGLPEYGVFSLRSPVRPNPVGLSLVRLKRVEGNVLHVSGLDAVDRTPVIDIKPYFENDIIFSPRTPKILPSKREMLQNLLLKQALNHHQEECPDLLLAVRMAVLAVEKFGHINLPDLCVMVNGSPCLADTLQGLCRARFSNPPRFEFRPSDSLSQSIWRRGDEVMNIVTLRPINRKGLIELADSDVFDIFQG